jgi:hypothetical protein
MGPMITARRTVRARRWLAGVAVVALVGIPYVWQAHETNANQAAQRHAGQVIERKLCADIATMARIKPPAGPASSNPSRAYEQAEHRAWAGLVSDLGCEGVTR